MVLSRESLFWPQTTCAFGVVGLLCWVGAYIVYSAPSPSGWLLGATFETEHGTWNVEHVRTGIGAAVLQDGEPISLLVVD